MPTTHFHSSSQPSTRPEIRRGEWSLQCVAGWPMTEHCARHPVHRLVNFGAAATLHRLSVSFHDYGPQSDGTSSPASAYTPTKSSAKLTTHSYLLYSYTLTRSRPFTHHPRTIYLTTSEMMFKQWCSIKTHAYFINSHAGRSRFLFSGICHANALLSQSTAEDARRVVLGFASTSSSSPSQLWFRIHSLIFEERTCWFSSCYALDQHKWWIWFKYLIGCWTLLLLHNIIIGTEYWTSLAMQHTKTHTMAQGDNWISLLDDV